MENNGYDHEPLDEDWIELLMQARKLGFTAGDVRTIFTKLTDGNGIPNQTFNIKQA
ncbi:hypothetical protein [Paenibacillus harenae]|uniref:Sin domain-containing protein n=1 Tax=Paenibacillus harenae TaxID=306543 RepID=A0ABT9U588_PAEHA|nr:hypothetical protein [Paenibacillus harenae]MDQ0063397.1 hypothetical protein [Paenibacillus harenae]MDQ0114817.1 hypothetical protein [Paenibacillus harenae]